MVYQNGQVVLEFDAQFGYDPVTDLAATNLSHRFLWNPQGVDQLLTDEKVWSLYSTEENENLWALADDQGSVRDLVDDYGRLRIERAFDSFGNVTSEAHYDTDGLQVSGPPTQYGYMDEAFAFTGRWFDKTTGLQNNDERWYDPSIGRWMSEDPIGFSGGDANLYRYVGNQPTTFVDASGLQMGEGGMPFPGYPGVPGGNGYGGPTPGSSHAGGYGNRFGLPDDFWRWYHRQVKQPGDLDIDKDVADWWYDDWIDNGRPDPEGHRTDPKQDPPPELPPEENLFQRLDKWLWDFGCGPCPGQ